VALAVLEGLRMVDDGGVSRDRLLGGRLTLLQPEAGLRAAIDPVLLAAAIDPRPGETVLELGTGTGVAALCLAARCPDVRIVGLELQLDLADLARRSVAVNGFGDRVAIIVGDVALPPLVRESFDHVMANPPFLAKGSGSLPPGRGKALAVAEASADLGRWVAAALAMVRRRGSVTFIHRADRLDDLIRALDGRAGEIVVFPLWPGEGKPAGRVLLRARKGVATPLSLAPGLVLHRADGRYTEEAESVLRDAAPLSLVPPAGRRRAGSA
jgi:tRNA1(Val) A37 N6-methylase TrmN6